MSKYTFVDAQQMQKDNPKTFDAPDFFDLNKLKEGEHVKVCAEPTNGKSAERFWVKIQKIKGNKITGIIDNDLIFTQNHGLEYEDIVQFEKRHIYQIH